MSTMKAVRDVMKKGSAKGARGPVKEAAKGPAVDPKKAAWLKEQAAMKEKQKGQGRAVAEDDQKGKALAEDLKKRGKPTMPSVEDRVKSIFGGDTPGAKKKTGKDASGQGALKAAAFTKGSDVKFGAGPEKATAAHEATHVVQQGPGRTDAKPEPDRKKKTLPTRKKAWGQP